jgi:hypothetical protein
VRTVIADSTRPPEVRVSTVHGSRGSSSGATISCVRGGTMRTAVPFTTSITVSDV